MLTDADKLEVAQKYAAASRENDAEAYRSMCAAEAVTWHNFDEVEVGVEQTVRTIAWLHRTVSDLAWHDVAVAPTSTGFVSQTIMTGTAPGGELRVHSCVIATLNDDGLIERIDEYLDPSQTATLRVRPTVS
jgi:ketosteroid isomerase-like protein